jgi:hypothetical protein
MLGDGMVCLAVSAAPAAFSAATTSRRKLKSSAKIGCGRPIRPSTRSAAVTHSMSPWALWNRTVMLWSARCTPPSW